MRMSKRKLVEQLLREAGPRGVTTAEFLAAGAGSRFGGRVHELRKELGPRESIEVEPIRPGSYRYTLRSSAPSTSAPRREPAASVTDDGRLFAPPTLSAALHDWDGGRP